MGAFFVLHFIWCFVSLGSRISMTIENVWRLIHLGTETEFKKAFKFKETTDWSLCNDFCKYV